MRCCNLNNKIKFEANAHHKVQFQSVTEVDSDVGAVTQSWSNLLSAWAIITPLKQSERYKFGKIQSPMTHKIIVRYNTIFADPLVSAKYRIMFGSRIFNIIQAINLEEANQFVEIVVIEGALI